MTITLLAPDGVPVTAQQERQASAALYGGGSGRPLGGRSGFRVDTPSNILTVTSTTWTLQPCSAQIDPGAATHQGMYGWASDQVISKAEVVAADSTYARKDIVYILVSDSTAGDGSGAVSAPVLYKAGAASANPEATKAVLPPRAFLVGTIDVPKAGGGSPTVTLNPARFVAAGAVLPVFSQAERDGLVAYESMPIARMDALGALQRYAGGKWLGGEHAEFTGAYGWTSGQTWGPGPLAKVPAASVCDDIVLSPGNDQIAVPPGAWNLHWRIKFYDSVNPANGKNLADSASFMQILDAADVELTSRDLAQGKSSNELAVQEVYFPTGGTFKLKLYTPTAGFYTRSTIRIGRAK